MTLRFITKNILARIDLCFALIIQSFFDIHFKLFAHHKFPLRQKNVRIFLIEELFDA